MKDSESIYNWEELTEKQQLLVVICHVEGFKQNGVHVELEGLQRLFRLGSPKVVIGMQDDTITYSRIHGDSTEVMKVITNNYLHEILKS